MIAKAVLDHSLVSQDDVNQALANLNEAVQHLIEKPVVVATDDLLVEADATVAPAPSSQSFPVASAAERRGLHQEPLLTSGTVFKEVAVLELVPEINKSEALSVQIILTDAVGSPITEDTIFQGRDGKNMQVNLQLTFPQSSTDREVTVELGRFLTFQDDTATRDIVEGLGQAADIVRNNTTITEPSDTAHLKDSSDNNYIDNNNVALNRELSPKAIYKVGQGIFYIPITLTINAETFAHLKGLSTSGNINGSTNYVEQTTPIKITATALNDGQAITVTTAVNHIATPDTRTPQLQHFRQVATPVAGYKFATEANDYQVDINLLHSDANNTGTRLFEVGSGFDVLLPKGVTFVELPAIYNQNIAASFDIQNKGTNADGVTTLTLRSTKPVYANYIGAVLRLKFDRTVHTGDSGQAIVHQTNGQSLLRNADAPVLSSGTTSNDIYYFKAVQEYVSVDQEVYPGGFSARTNLLKYLGVMLRTASIIHLLSIIIVLLVTLRD